MELDGLVLKITYDFLINLENNGLNLSNIRIRNISRDSSFGGDIFVNYSNTKNFFDRWKDILEDRKFLCRVGSFPVLQNIQIINKNLNFSNLYKWYDVLGNRYFITNIKLDTSRSKIYEKEIQRYIDLINKLLDQYKIDVMNAISSRTQLYVDPCYVDGGYISNTKN